MDLHEPICTFAHPHNCSHRHHAPHLPICTSAHLSTPLDVSSCLVDMTEHRIKDTMGTTYDSLAHYHIAELANYSAQLNLSLGEYFHGAPLFSVLPNMLFRLAGACESSMTE